jgi:hypothetical protein
MAQMWRMIYLLGWMDQRASIAINQNQPIAEDPVHPDLRMTIINGNYKTRSQSINDGRVNIAQESPPVVESGDSMRHKRYPDAGPRRMRSHARKDRRSGGS